MGQTLLNGRTQIQSGSILRAMLNTTTAASAVITKVIAGSNVTLSYTGADSGTGDVTVNATGTLSLVVTQTPVADTAYTMLVTDQSIQYTSLTATRIVTLVAASAFTAGQRVTIGDSSGSLTAAKQITITPAGSDTIVSRAGSQASYFLPFAYGEIILESNGSNSWKVVDTPYGSGYFGTTQSGQITSATLFDFTLSSTAAIAVQPSPGASGAGLVEIGANSGYPRLVFSSQDARNAHNLGVIYFQGLNSAPAYTAGAYLTVTAAEAFSSGHTAATVSLSTVNLAETEAVRWFVDGNGAFNIGSAVTGSPAEGDCNIAGDFLINGAAIPSVFNEGAQTANTAISNVTTATTMGVTMPSQTLAAGSVWRIHAYGTITSGSSATTRNVLFRPFWGSTALTAFTFAVKVSTAATTTWDLEFEIHASSTTAAWVTGKCHNNIVAGTVAAPLLSLLTPTSNTGLTSGAQTIDLRANFSAGVTSDAISVQNVTIERKQ